MPSTTTRNHLLTEHRSDYHQGLTSAEASRRRNRDNDTTDGLNTVAPPLNCPKWVCCLLPCIDHIPSMKLFRTIQPEDAEVLREGAWIRYDAASLVKGDIVRLFEGDVVPADCVVLSLGMDHARDEGDEEGGGEGCSEMTVDSHNITGEAKPRVISASDTATNMYYGSRVLDGACIALVVATGGNTLLARLMREGRWPPGGEDISSELARELEMGSVGDNGSSMA